MDDKKIIIADGICITTEGYTTVDDFDFLNVVVSNNVPESNYASFVKSRGTLDNRKSLEENDEIFSFFYSGYDSEDNPAWTAELTVGTEGEIKPGIVPGYFAFKLTNQEGIANTCLTLHSDGSLEYNRSTIVPVGNLPGQANVNDIKYCVRVKLGDEYYAMPLFGINK